MYNILIAEDEPKIRELIRKYTKFEGHTLSETANGMKAVEMCRENSYDIVLLDIMLPDLDGFSVCREIRKICNTPVIFLSARGEEYDKIHGFEAGADDYVVKPFSPKELMMRIDAVIKRYKIGVAAAESASDIYTLDTLVVDFKARTVTTDGKRASLSPKEYELLSRLIKSRGTVLTREELIVGIWKKKYSGDERTLDTHIKLLRRCIGVYADNIITVRGIGYRFDEKL